MTSIALAAAISPTRLRPDVADPVNLDILLERIAGGDRPALKALYILISPRLFAVLVRMVRRSEIAEDLLQDVFVTVWRKAYQFDLRRGNAEAWLFSITRRKAIDRLRISNREVVGLADDVASLEPQSDANRGWNDSEMCLSIRTCIANLEPEITRALELCYKYGLTHEELAVHLKVPLGTAKSWVRRGLLQLKEALKGDDRL